MDKVINLDDYKRKREERGEPCCDPLKDIERAKEEIRKYTGLKPSRGYFKGSWFNSVEEFEQLITEHL